MSCRSLRLRTLKLATSRSKYYNRIDPTSLHPMDTTRDNVHLEYTVLSQDNGYTYRIMTISRSRQTLSLVSQGDRQEDMRDTNDNVCRHLQRYTFYNVLDVTLNNNCR